MNTPEPSTPSAPQPSTLEVRIQQVGIGLYEALKGVLDSIPGAPPGPQKLATHLGLDKVLTSRLLKALRAPDPVSVLHSTPGPAPLRRFLRSASKLGAQTEAAEMAVDAFDHLIRQEIGDRSALDTVISSWLPEARVEFETRRKQSAFKAMSELRGCSADLNLSTVFFNPSEDGETIDIVWLMGHLGLCRLRPGASATFVTRRMVEDAAGRRPTNLQGEVIEGLDRGRLDQFCTLPPAHLVAHRFDNLIRYSLAGEEFGPGSAKDLLFGEVNLQEMPRYVPQGVERKAFSFAEVPVPCKTLVFDALVHEELYPGADPRLMIYDTTLEGVADPNDPSRSLDQLDLLETVQSLGRGSSRLRISEAPRHVDAVRHVFSSMGWPEERFRAYRCRLEFPLHGSQVVFAFPATQRPDAS